MNNFAIPVKTLILCLVCLLIALTGCITINQPGTPSQTATTNPPTVTQTLPPTATVTVTPTPTPTPTLTVVPTMTPLPVPPMFTVLPIPPFFPITPITPTEDCISFSAINSQAALIGGRWKIVDGANWLMDFAGSEVEAKRALSIIQYYGMNKMCFVGRPNPPMQYFLVNNQSPVGSFTGEDVIGFNPANMEAKNIGGRWKVVDGSNWLLDFNAEEGEARLANAIIKMHGFRYIGFVGRPNPSMMYFRR